MSDLPAALLCQTIYQRPQFFEQIFDIQDFYVGYAFLDGCINLVCRGSVTDMDWLHDAESIESIDHPILGPVGKGFVIGVDETYAAIRKSVKTPVGSTIRLCGHSLGCAHAAELAGLFINDGFVVSLTLFEPPRCCGTKLMEMLKSSTIRCYRNGNDPVTMVPHQLDHARELIQLDCPPVTGDLTVFGRHHMPLVITALAIHEGGYDASKLST